MPESVTRRDSYSAFGFLVEIDGVTVAGFSEFSGLTDETDPVEYQDGDPDTVANKVPGLRKFQTIVLKRGVTRDRDFWEWSRTVIKGSPQPQTVAITVLDEARAPVRRFNFRNGWPSKWEGPTFNAKANEVAIETLEISVEGLELD